MGSLPKSHLKAELCVNVCRLDEIKKIEKFPKDDLFHAIPYFTFLQLKYGT